MSSKKGSKIGDILEIPLSDGKKGYAQYVFFDKRNGDLVQVYDIVSNKDEDPTTEEIINTKPLFRPVLTLVKAATKYHGWKIIKNIPIEDFSYPLFLSGWPGYWYLWDGIKEIQLGDSVPEKYQKLEYLSSYSPDLIAERIVTGVKPFEEMITTNRNTLVLGYSKNLVN